MDNGVFLKIRQITTRIPIGKVTTYGHLAALAGIADARVVGWAMHGNRDPEVPCHRVVNARGGLAANYAFGGDEVQRIRLKEEGVTFNAEHQVNLKNHLWTGK